MYKVTATVLFTLCDIQIPTFYLDESDICNEEHAKLRAKHIIDPARKAIKLDITVEKV